MTHLMELIRFILVQREMLPLVEKYRPKSLTDVIGNPEIVQRLKGILVSKNMPHLLLTGSAGIGKTSSIHALAHDLLGEHYKQAVLELNASDERGIDVVRNQIKQFAQQKVTLPPNMFKIIILDEVDSMTTGSQQALRRIMEVYSNTTRFALACNLSSKVLEPIQSRCAILRYARITDEEISERIRQIADLESIEITNEFVKAVAFTSEGDMRQALNILQSASTFTRPLTAETVYKVADTPHPTIVQEGIRSCLNKDLDGAIEKIHGLYKQGYSPNDIMTTMLRVIKYMPLKEGLLRPTMAKMIAERLYQSSQYGNETIIGCVSVLARFAQIK
eukprot:NODE_144_length_15804_cov_0.729131.p6 type:complete len:333 gc:universal NODE_144_length_15804_cov_0.729131:2926-1928(-)